MDRLKMTLAGCGLAAVLTVSGCRSMRSEVPPGARSPAKAASPRSASAPTRTPATGPGAGAGAVAQLRRSRFVLGPAPRRARSIWNPALSASDKYAGRRRKTPMARPGPVRWLTPPATGADPMAAPPAGATPAALAIPNSVGTGLSGLPPASQ